MTEKYIIVTAKIIDIDYAEKIINGTTEPIIEMQLEDIDSGKTYTCALDKKEVMSIIGIDDDNFDVIQMASMARELNGINRLVQFFAPPKGNSINADCIRILAEKNQEEE
jgi:hypothetical protein